MEICGIIGGLMLLGTITRAVVHYRRARRVRTRLRHELMREARLCIVCGYDVRACTDVCSECGTPIGR